MADESVSRGEYERLLSESMRRKQKVRELTTQLAEVNGKLAETATERDKAVSDRATLAADRDQYKQKLETQPDELRQQVSDLTNKIRTRSHRDKFESLAKPLVNPEALQTAWDLLQWKPEADEVDEPKMTAAISDLVGRNAVLKIPAESAGAGGGATATTQQARAAGPGTSRGGEARQTDPNADLAARYPNPNRLA